jgi:hypothetical protein
MAMILLATAAVAYAQVDNNDIAPSVPAPTGPAPSQNVPSRGDVRTCPLTTVPMIDKWGYRTCVSRSQRPLQQPLPDGLVPVQAAKPKRKKFELSNKCPTCK